MLRLQRNCHDLRLPGHYFDVIMSTIASQITSLTIVYSTVYSDADQRKHQSSASLASVWGIYRGPVNSQHKWPVTRKMFPFDDVIMKCYYDSFRWSGFSCVPSSHRRDSTLTMASYSFPRTLDWRHGASNSNSTVFQQLLLANNKENIKAPQKWRPVF